MRVHTPESLNHVTGKGNGSQEIFGNPQENLLSLGILDDVLRKTGACLLSYCLMVNHFHLLVKVGLISLSNIMQRLETRYAKAFNKHRGRLGHVFQGRFKSKVITDKPYLRNVLAYIPNNPVKAGLVADPAEWAWSSHSQVVGPIHSSMLALDELFSLLGRDKKSALRRYKILLATSDLEFEPSYDDEPGTIVRPRQEAARPSLADIAQDVIGSTGIDFPHLRSRTRTHGVSDARRAFCLRAAARGYGVSEIAAFLGICPSSAHSHINP
ncbi:MAG: transposase [Elusimicrobia bacterium]|nr:transposase [Elusimicrobiota bacterium]